MKSLGLIRVTDLSLEPLEGLYDYADARLKLERGGFPDYPPGEVVAMSCAADRGKRQRDRHPHPVRVRAGRRRLMRAPVDFRRGLSHKWVDSHSGPAAR